MNKQFYKICIGTPSNKQIFIYCSFFVEVRSTMKDFDEYSTYITICI